MRVSRQAIAAALARQDLSGGERLVAFSLASFAGRDGRAWPGAPAAAARAGLGRSRYLHDRDRLVRRGLVVVEAVASGRGRATTVALRFAAEGPWWEGEINAELFEAVLSRTRSRGPARRLLAAMAALADPDGVVRGVSNHEICVAGGLEDRTYRRARPELLESGELVLLSGSRGRGNTNVWLVRALAEIPASARPGTSRGRVVPRAGVRPVLASVAPGASAPAMAEEARPQPEADGRDPGGAVGEAGSVVTGLVEGRGCQDRTLFELPAPENPAQNPAENPAANAREGGEPQNPRIEDPPCPPEGGGGCARSWLSAPTSPNAAGDGGGWWSSIQSSCAGICAIPPNAIAGRGTRLAVCSLGWSVRTRSASGWTPCALLLPARGARWW